MIKKDFNKIFQVKAGFMTKERTEEVTEAFLETLKEALLTEDEVVFRNFGAFKKTYRKVNNNRNPHTGELIDCKPKLHIKFKTGKSFLEVLNKEE
ncbi:MAG: HU family DNA-binding protein [Fusobacterium sp.]|uniref:HU family DNA-binding protein n=1 Tax=Fusobacterium sp. TaxID=68766 RepID=UPI0039953B4B